MTTRPKMRDGSMYLLYVGNKYIGDVGKMGDNEVMIALTGKNHEVISADRFNAWVAKQPTLSWRLDR